MTLNVIILVVYAIASFMAYFSYRSTHTDGVALWYTYEVINMTVSCLIAFILFQVSGKRQVEEESEQHQDSAKELLEDSQPPQSIEHSLVESRSTMNLRNSEETAFSKIMDDVHLEDSFAERTL